MRAGDEELGVVPGPGMVEGHVIRHEVEHQLQTPRLQTIAQGGERRVAYERLMHVVAGDGKARPRDVLFAKIGQRLFELPAPLSVAARRLLPRGTGLPDAQHFFFSSRRRHTRCLSDWSSDVCSSD